MLLSKAVEGFMFEVRGGRYSPSYVPTIQHQFDLINSIFGERELDSVNHEDWVEFFSYLRNDYKPRRFSGDTKPLAEATIDNYWKAIRSFYNWCTQHKILSIERPDLNLPRPKFILPQVEPFSEQEVKKLLDASQSTHVSKQSGKNYNIKRPNADRDKSIILILLDTGLRLGEFSRLQVGDVNLETGEVHVRPFLSGIKSRPRTVFFGKRTKASVWTYIAKLQSQSDPSQSLFDLKSSSIRLMINRLGRNAKVPHTHPHRFRHTFAVNYLRNGGDVFTLQRLMGHSDLQMTIRYVRFVKADLANVHHNASPVDNWKL